MTTLIAVKVPRDMIEDLDTTTIEQTFIEMAADPERTRRAQGSYWFTFEGYDDTPEPLALIPACREYIQQLHQQVPHLFYFLAPHDELGQLMLFLSVFADPANVALTREGQLSVTPDERSAQALVASAAATGEFAREMADDVDGIVARWLQPMVPHAIVDVAREAALQPR